MFGLFKKTDPLWKKFQQEAEKKAMFTPDIEELQSRYAWNVFIYNECKDGGPKRSVLNGSVYAGHAYTESSDFVLYKKLLENETFPIAFQISEDQILGRSSYIGDMGQVMGENYLMRPDDIIHLDNYMLNTVQFNRKRIKIVIPFHENETASMDVKAIDAWMYVADREFWDPQISDAESKKRFAKSARLFCAKENNNKETLSAYFVFDYDAELETAPF